MKRLLCVLLLATAALAQQPAPAKPAPAAAPATIAPGEHPATAADVQRLFAALRLEKQMETMQSAMRNAMKQIIDQTMAEQTKGLTEAQKKKFQDHMAKITSEAMDFYPIPEMMQDMTPVYVENYSREEIDALVAFYNSPMGSRLLDKQPKVMQEGMALLMPKIQARLRDKTASMQQETMQLAEELAKEKDSSPQK